MKQLKNSLNTQQQTAKACHRDLQDVQKANEELMLLLDSIDEVLWSFDVPSKKVLQISASCEKVYGYTPADFMADPFLCNSVIHPDDLKLIINNDALLAQGKQVKNLYRIIHKTGAIRFVEVKITPVMGADGVLKKLQGLARDVTKEKNAIRATMESEYLFRQFFDTAPEAVFILNSTTSVICDYNKKAVELMKYTSTELLSKTPTDLSPLLQEDGTPSSVKSANFIQQVINGKNLAFEWLIKDATGKIIPCEVRLTKIIDNGLVLIRSSVIDISERKAAEEKLKASEANLAAIIENTDAHIYSLDTSFRYLTFNSTLKNKLKEAYNIDIKKGDVVFDFLEKLQPDEAREWEARYAEALKGQSIHFEKSFEINGSSWHTAFSIHPIWEDEVVIGLSCFARDITNQKLADLKIKELNESLEIKVKERTAELLDTNRELETFSYTVSHDLQAPLRVICGFAKILMTDYAQKLDDECKSLLDIVNSNAAHMSCLIHDLLQFSKQGKEDLVKREVNMDELLVAVVDEIRFTNNNSTAQIIINPVKRSVCDLNMLKQVWVNLISNALKYSSKKEKPIIEIGCNEVDNKAVYYVKDNGAGFDMKFADNLFSVFHRLHSKDQFDGTGVGLATVQRIINKHGGHIWANAKVNEGAEFYFTLSS